MAKKNCEARTGEVKTGKKNFKDELYEKYGKKLTQPKLDIGEYAISQVKTSIDYAAYCGHHYYSRIFINGLKIEAVINYFKSQGFDVFSEQRYAKDSNNTGNQYTYIKISW